jgi:hypothetical protein
MSWRAQAENDAYDDEESKQEEECVELKREPTESPTSPMNEIVIAVCG